MPDTHHLKHLPNNLLVISYHWPNTAMSTHLPKNILDIYLVKNLFVLQNWLIAVVRWLQFCYVPEALHCSHLSQDQDFSSLRSLSEL